MDQQRHKLIREQFPDAAYKDVSFRQDDTGRQGIPVRFYLFEDGWQPQIEAYRRAFRKEVNRRHTAAKYTIYDLLPEFGSYMHDALKCAGYDPERAPFEVEEKIAYDLLDDFGTLPEGEKREDWHFIRDIAIAKHYHPNG